MRKVINRLIQDFGQKFFAYVACGFFIVVFWLSVKRRIAGYLSFSSNEDLIWLIACCFVFCILVFAIYLRCGVYKKKHIPWMLSFLLSWGIAFLVILFIKVRPIYWVPLIVLLCGTTQLLYLINISKEDQAYFQVMWLYSYTLFGLCSFSSLLISIINWIKIKRINRILYQMYKDAGTLELFRPQENPFDISLAVLSLVSIGITVLLAIYCKRIYYRRLAQDNSPKE